MKKDKRDKMSGEKIKKLLKKKKTFHINFIKRINVQTDALKKILKELERKNSERNK